MSDGIVYSLQYSKMRPREEKQLAQASKLRYIHSIYTWAKAKAVGLQEIETCNRLGISLPGLGS